MNNYLKTLEICNYYSQNKISTLFKNLNNIDLQSCIDLEQNSADNNNLYIKKESKEYLDKYISHLNDLLSEVTKSILISNIFIYSTNNQNEYLESILKILNTNDKFFQFENLFLENKSIPNTYLVNKSIFNNSKLLYLLEQNTQNKYLLENIQDISSENLDKIYIQINSIFSFLNEQPFNFPNILLGKHQPTIDSFNKLHLLINKHIANLKNHLLNLGESDFNSRQNKIDNFFNDYHAHLSITHNKFNFNDKLKNFSKQVLFFNKTTNNQYNIKDIIPLVDISVINHTPRSWAGYYSLVCNDKVLSHVFINKISIPPSTLTHEIFHHLDIGIQSSLNQKISSHLFFEKIFNEIKGKENLTNSLQSDNVIFKSEELNSYNKYIETMVKIQNIYTFNKVDFNYNNLLPDDEYIKFRIKFTTSLSKCFLKNYFDEIDFNLDKNNKIDLNKLPFRKELLNYINNILLDSSIPDIYINKLEEYPFAAKGKTLIDLSNYSVTQILPIIRMNNDISKNFISHITYQICDQIMIFLQNKNIFVPESKDCSFILNKQSFERLSSFIPEIKSLKNKPKIILNNNNLKNLRSIAIKDNYFPKNFLQNLSFKKDNSEFQSYIRYLNYPEEYFARNTQAYFYKIIQQQDSYSKINKNFDKFITNTSQIVSKFDLKKTFLKEDSFFFSKIRKITSSQLKHNNQLLFHERTISIDHITNENLTIIKKLYNSLLDNFIVTNKNINILKSEFKNRNTIQ